VKSRSHDTIPVTWSGGTQLIARALTRGAPKGVAFGTAPMLAVDPADPVPAAPERDPNRQLGRQQRFDRRERGVAHERHRLDQNQIGSLGLERARQQPDRLPSVGRVDVAVDAERDRDLVAAAGLARSVPGQPDPAAREVHPVERPRGIQRPESTLA
jgi:hypothetical protein